MLKISLAKPGFLKNKEHQSLSPAASLLLSGVDLLQKASEKELEVCAQIYALYTLFYEPSFSLSLIILKSCRF